MTLRAQPAEADDCRSREVAFVSHCLLNQNTRYPGGAVHPGPAPDVVREYVDDGVGIVQMACPEQRAWGGVPKRALLWLLDHPKVARASGVLVPAVMPYLRLRYRVLARRVARDIADYRRSDLDVVEILGVAGSPTCGVHTALDLAAAGRSVGRRRPGDVSLKEVVGEATVNGRGVYTDELIRALHRRSLEVPIREHVLPGTPVPMPAGRG